MKNQIGFYYFRDAEHMLAGSIARMQELLEPRAMSLKLLPFAADYYDHIDLPAEVRRQALTGALLVAMNTPGCLANLRRLEQEDFPYVRMGNKHFAGNLRAPLVTGNDRQAAQDGLQHLIERGHLKIGYVAYRKDHSGQTTYMETIGTRPLFRPQHMLFVDFDGTRTQLMRLPAQEIMRDYLKRNPELTAVVLEHGGLAVHLLQAALGLGMRLPQQLTLLCLEDWPITFESVTPRISAMHMPRTLQAETAVEHLLRILDTGRPEKESIHHIGYRLEERESIAPPPAN